MLDALTQDARFAARSMRKSPLFTLVAIAVIAIGIGAVSAIYTVADAVVLRPVPGVADPSRVVVVGRSDRSGHGSMSASYPYYHFLAQASQRMSGIAAWDMLQLTVSRAGEGTTAQGNLVSGNYFSVLGIRPALGRFFARDEDSIPGLKPVVVISHEFWQRYFGGDSSAVGRQVAVNGHQFTVIGVAPAHFSGLFPVIRIDAWVPMMMQDAVRPDSGLLNDVGSGWLQMFGRIAPGATPESARAELVHLVGEYSRANETGTNVGMADFSGVALNRLSGLPTNATTSVLVFFVVLLVLSALVLMIASVNVTGMLLVRGVTRRREIAVRIALGAGQPRLFRQLLTESVLLFGCGGAVGVGLAILATRLLSHVQLPVGIAMVFDLSPHLRTLGVTAAATLLAGLLFGLAPALRASRADLATSLRGDSAGAGRKKSRLRTALVIAQVAASLLLLTASGLFVRAWMRGQHVKPGYDIAHVATAEMDVSRSGYDSTHAQAFYRLLATRLRALPGVTAVGYTRQLPLSLSSSAHGVSVPGYQGPAAQHGTGLTVDFADVDPGYFDALHVPITAGRAFRATDDASAAPVAIINRTFARTVWPGLDPIGRTFVDGDHPVTIVGVTADAKFSKLDEPDAPFMYQPLAQDWTSDINLLVRTSGDAAQLAPGIRATVRALDAALPVPAVTTMEQSSAIVLLPQRIAAMVTVALGAAGLLLSLIGLYGVVAFSVAQRGREMGIRLALGARPGQVLGLVVGEGMRVVAVGLVTGLLLALLMTRVLRPFLFGVSPLDLVTLTSVTLALVAATLLASWIPARRAAGIDPMVALREE